MIFKQSLRGVVYVEHVRGYVTRADGVIEKNVTDLAGGSLLLPLLFFTLLVQKGPF